jgi:hypothetical protein
MDWLLANPESESNGEINAEQATAQSLKCDDCYKLFKDGFSFQYSFCLASAAEVHAMKTSHSNFSETTDMIKPLSPEEKAKKVQELQERLKSRREARLLREAEEEKAREKIRRRTGKEIAESREKFQELEMKKAMEARKKEKEEDRLAKEKIRAQIEADRKERLLKVNS